MLARIIGELITNSGGRIMKKIIYTLFAFAAVTFVSCTKEESTPENEQTQPEVELVPMTFTAGVDTKVTLDGNVINWSKDDAISIFDGTTNRKFTIVENSIKGNQATFTGEVAVSAAEFVALYPYTEKATYNNGKISSVPLSESGTFAPIATASATTENPHLNFNTVIGFVKFQLADADGISSVTISGNNGELIGGSISIETGNSIKVTATQPTATVSANSETIYIPVAPATLSKGITISADKKSSISSSKTTTIEANKAFNLNTLPALTSGAPADNYVAYIHGFDLTVGDVVINNETHKDVKLIEATQSKQSLTGSKGVYFLKVSGEESSFALTGNLGIDNDTYYIGCGSSNVTISFSKYAIYFKKATLGFKNVSIDGKEQVNYLIGNVNTTSNSEKLIVDECIVSTIGSIYYIHNSYPSYACKSFYFSNSDFELLPNGTTATALKILIDLTQYKSDVKSDIYIDNCIFYNSDKSYVEKLIYKPTTNQLGEISFTNNTVFNLHPGTDNGLIHVGNVENITIKNNLFNFYTINKNEYIVYTTGNPTYTQENNYCYRRGTDSNTLYLINGCEFKFSSDKISEATYPFKSNKTDSGATR